MISNTVFTRNFFEFGIITNARDDKEAFDVGTPPLNPYPDYLSDRKYMGYSTFGFYNCLVKNNIKNHDLSKAAEYCHSITVSNSTFQDYNPFTFTHNGTKTTSVRRFVQEGMVLAVQNVQGPIHLKNNTFKSMVTSLIDEIVQDSSKVTGFQCLSTFCKNQVKGCKMDSSEKTKIEGKNKLNIDKILTEYFYEHYLRTIGSIIYIRNVTYGLSFYNNTFSDNIYKTGAILVEGLINTPGFLFLNQHFQFLL